jgi:hypothetical protein
MLIKLRRLWLVTAVIFLVAGGMLAAYHYHYAARRLDMSVYVILALAGGWLGALVGGAVEWLRFSRSPLEPLFAERFEWHYRQRFWLRFAVVFSGAWLLFVIISALVAVMAGAFEEARTFVTRQGLTAIFLFVVVFGVEGALVGGVVDLVGYITRKKHRK